MTDRGGAITRREDAGLLLSEQRYRTFFEAATDAIFIVEAGRITDCNRRAVDLFARPREELVGSTPAALSPARQPDGADSVQAARQRLAAAQAGEPQRFEWQHARPGGEVFTAEVELRPLELGSQTLVVGTVRDVTALQHALLELESALARQQAIFESSTVGIFLVGDARHVTMANRRTCELLGFTAEELVGRTTEQFHPSHEHWASFGARHYPLLARGQMVRVECQLRRKDGEVREFFVSGRAIAPPDLARGTVWVIDDVTEQKQLRQMLVQSEKMLSVGGLAAGMAHEINNPLGGILQGVQNVRRRLLEDLPANARAAEEVGLDRDRLRAYLQARDLPALLAGIQEAGERAAATVANMLRFSRPDRGMAGVTRLHDLLDRAVELASIQYDLKKRYDFRSIEIRREYGSPIPPIRCNALEIEQVILNLLTNAAQALAERTDGLPPVITLRTYAADGRACIEVEDNGPGIAPDAISRVFEPFFTTKEVGVGTGLGLSVSYFIVTQNHGGTMEVSSRPGELTRFTICLPLAEVET